MSLSTHYIQDWLGSQQTSEVTKKSMTELWDDLYRSLAVFANSLDDKAQKHTGHDAAEAFLTQCWSNTLANRHTLLKRFRWLLEQLEARLEEGEDSRVLDTTEWVYDPTEVIARTAVEPDLDSLLTKSAPHTVETAVQLGLLLAESEHDASAMSLWFELRRGDPSVILRTLNRNRWEDKLARLEGRLVLLERLTEEQGVSHRFASQAVKRLVHLWGLTVEQDMDYLQPGHEAWYERCEFAADLYSYENSARVRRLHVLMQADIDRSNRDAVQDIEGEASSQTILEIG